MGDQIIENGKLNSRRTAARETGDHKKVSCFFMRLIQGKGGLFFFKFS